MLDERLAEVRSRHAEREAEMDRRSSYSIFVGAVAVCKIGTLVTDKPLLIHAMKEAQKDLDAVPERFRPKVEAFDSYLEHNCKESDEADRIARKLHSMEEGVGWARHMGDAKTYPCVYDGELFFMNDENAASFIAKEAFTPEELDWLWMFAQAMHALPDKPVVRRGL